MLANFSASVVFPEPILPDDGDMFDGFQKLKG